VAKCAVHHNLSHFTVNINSRRPANITKFLVVKIQCVYAWLHLLPASHSGVRPHTAARYPLPVPQFTRFEIRNRKCRGDMELESTEHQVHKFFTNIVIVFFSPSRQMQRTMPSNRPRPLPTTSSKC
jgi:hypothetical protein